MKPGDKYNKLTAVKKANKSYNGNRWLFNCDCGNEREFSALDVTLGRAKSCGCVAKAIRDNGIQAKVERHIKTMKDEPINLDIAHKMFGGNRTSVSRALHVLTGRGLLVVGDQVPGQRVYNYYRPVETPDYTNLMMKALSICGNKPDWGRVL